MVFVMVVVWLVMVVLLSRWCVGFCSRLLSWGSGVFVVLVDEVWFWVNYMLFSVWVLLFVVV